MNVRKQRDGHRAKEVANGDQDFRVDPVLTVAAGLVFSLLLAAALAFVLFGGS